MSLYELTLGWRYTRAKRRNRFVSFIALLSMMGIALGVAALIVVLSVMNGFQTQLRSAILAATAHVQVRGADGPVANWQALEAVLKQTPEVKAVAAYVEGDALFTFAPANRPGLLRGVDPATENVVGDVEKYMRVGKLTDLTPGSFSIILGRDMAQMLGVRRTSVSLVANTLQTAGLIHNGRGRITVVDRRRLEARACECYRGIKREFSRLLNPPVSAPGMDGGTVTRHTPIPRAPQAQWSAAL